MDPTQQRGGYPTTQMMQVPPGMTQVPMGAMVNPQFPQYGMMVPGGPMMQVPMQPMQMAPMATHLTQMLADSARGGRASNVFFKTRLCNKWRAGSCPFGEKCTYAHGQHELRYIPPEILSNLERSQALQQDAQQQASLDHQHHHHLQDARVPPSPGGDATDPRSKSLLFYKTKICIPFMSHGYCQRGSACTFAHGFQDIRSQDVSIGMIPQHHYAMLNPNHTHNNNNNHNHNNNHVPAVNNNNNNANTINRQRQVSHRGTTAVPANILTRPTAAAAGSGSASLHHHIHAITSSARGSGSTIHGEGVPDIVDQSNEEDNDSQKELSRGNGHAVEENIDNNDTTKEEGTAVGDDTTTTTTTTTTNGGDHDDNTEKDGTDVEGGE